MKINLISNTSWYLFNFRSSLIKRLIAEGHEVNVIAPFDNYVDRLVKLGAKYHEVKLTRFKKSIIFDLYFIFKLIRFNQKMRPDVVHHFTIKPVIYGSIAAWFSPKMKVINSIPGLGLSFNIIYKKKWINRFIMFLYRLAFKDNHIIIFQNPDNMNFFIKNEILNFEQCHLIKSSGVDIETFNRKNVEKNDDLVRFGIMCRMIWSKGIEDFVEASKIVHSKNLNTEFYVLGSPDPHSPDSVSYDWLQRLNSEEHLFWLEHNDNVRDFLQKIDVFVLPTYYPEGLPKSLLEAAAMKLPLITTNTPGCKEVVRDGYNGYLVNIKDQIDLSQKMYKISKNKKDRISMGENSRKIVETDYDVKIVNDKTIKLYNL